MKRHPFLGTVIVVCAFGNFFFQIIVLSLVVLAELQGNVQRHDRPVARVLRHRRTRGSILDVLWSMSAASQLGV